MANTYVLIASNTLGSSAASVTFSSIPGTYTDLVLRVSARDTSSGVSGTFKMRPNGNNSSSNYSQTELTGNGSSAASARTTTSTGLSYFYGYYPHSTATSNTFGSYELYLPNYSNSEKKPLSVYSASESNTASITYANYALAGLFHDTTAVTSLVVEANGSFASGSSFFLYGIKNS